MPDHTTTRRIESLYTRSRSVWPVANLSAYRLSHLKSPRIVFPLVETESKAHSANQINSGWNSEVSHAHEIAIQMEPSPAAELIPRHIHRWQIKDSFEIVRKIGMLVRNGKTGGAFKATVLHQKDVGEENWQETLQPKGERHFQIGRITNYFS